MSAYLFLPIYFLRFWYIEAPSAILDYFLSLNSAFFHLFSLPLFLRTFFQPVKNEYRKGLVGFSVGMGIAIKSGFILVDLMLFLCLLLLEMIIIGGFLAFPLFTVALLLW